ncbi:solute carrier family 35 member B1-like [Corticium candelabrum]|uniref:solute carrier family 35 member B1-like n=1 Tax=Corticium candelabrum TaxID=121492 RepID=UPI002E254B9D|nr:solute carrier family 35 member B1-like [Corticium candelabrum]
MWDTIGEKSKLTVCFVGIFVSYLLYGVVQEKVTRGKYGEGENAERFTFTLALVCIQCIINAVFAKLVTSVIGAGKTTTPWSLFTQCSVSYMGAMLASNWSLKYVTYPTQVLGKSCKPIPVMLLAVILGKKRYPWTKYIVVLLIVSGVALFLYKDSHHRPHGSTSNLFGIGEMLLFLSLFLDGITGVIQDKMKTQKTHPLHIMLYLNIWSIFLLGIGLLLTGEGIQAVYFIIRHPEVMIHLVLFGLTSAIGQVFIFVTITTFSPLTCSIITTTRKFFTILVSVVMFANPLLSHQWLGVFLVFLGLGLENVIGKKQTSNR